MDKKLRQLFEYQRFEQAPRLQNVIEQTLARMPRALEDDELFYVNAAGRPEEMANKDKEEQRK